MDKIDQKVAKFQAFGLGIMLVFSLFLLSGCAHSKHQTVFVQPASPVIRNGDTNKTQQFSVVTYNIWGLPGWMNGASSKRFPKIARELERINADLVLLQEVWSTKAMSAVPSNGVWSLASTSRDVAFYQRNGLVTLSRFPILGGDFRPFSDAVFPDSVVSKGALKVTVELPEGRRVNVWNVHLQSGRYMQPIRSRQIEELIRWVEQANDGQCADLIAGDFNIAPDDVNYARIKEVWLDFSDISLQTHLVAKPNRDQSVDYLFLRPRPCVRHLQVREQQAFASNGSEALSDHLGLRAFFSFSVEDPIMHAVTQIVMGVPFSQIAGEE